MKLPEQYVTMVMNQYCQKVSYIQSSNSYRSSCCFCNEGNSNGIKTRLNYYVNKDLIICYNCSRSYSSLFFVKEITKKSISQIIKDVQENYNYGKNINFEDNIEKKTKPSLTLPYNSINLCDETQTNFYKNEQIIQDALKYIKSRRLDTAINKHTYYISLVDFLHKNRLVIPFVDEKNKITYFQSRAIYKKDEYPCKYLGKINANKSIFGLNKINIDLSYLFIFEGPIDSCFVQNGISMAGLQMTEYQESLLQPYFLFEKIWVLDNQLENIDVLKKTVKLLQNNQKIFIWPKHYIKFKDINDLCCSLKINYISPTFFIKNSYTGKEAYQKLLEAKEFTQKNKLTLQNQNL
jgi:hypothetical protein